MSQDFRLTWPCSHLTIEEVVELEDDRTTLRGSQPIGSVQTVRVWVNDEIIIPQSGLYSSGQLYSTTSGPFDIDTGSDELVITTSSGTTNVSFDVSRLTRFTTSEVVTRIQRVAIPTLIVENANGHLLLTDFSRTGPESVVTVSGSAAQELGFGSSGDQCGRTSPRQKSARGKQLYPGWDVLSDLTAEVRNLIEVENVDLDLLSGVRDRFVRFREPIRNNPVFKLTYAAQESHCLRCRAYGVENDIRYGPDGQAIFIENEDLLHQGALKIVLTDRGSNPYHPFYGTKISSRIGSKVVAGITALINEDVRQALARFQAVQREQGLYQAVSSKERLYRVISVQAYSPEGDPTSVIVEIVVQNASSEPITLKSLFTVPSVIALLAGNAASALTSPNASVVGL